MTADGQTFHTLIGKNRLLLECLKLCRKIAGNNSPVMILGESGVGKELFAEQIHLAGSRKNKPLVRVNCAALSDNLLESELFGHVSGAFTGAVTERKGRFEQANGGTIFLDEIGEMSLKVQAKLLRVLEDNKIEKLGSGESGLVDVRLITATSKNIEQALQQGLFRRDIFYRLNVFSISIPPLRFRKDDMTLLLDFFIRQIAKKNGMPLKTFSKEAIACIYDYNWPGNVRELRNVIERAMILSDGLTQIDTVHLKIDRESEANAYRQQNYQVAVTLFKKNFIQNALADENWHQTNTAKRIGLQRTYLAKLIKELEIKKGVNNG